MTSYSTLAARRWAALLQDGREVYASISKENEFAQQHFLHRTEVGGGVVDDLRKLKTDDHGSALAFLNRYGAWEEPGLEIGVSEWRDIAIGLQRALWLLRAIESQSESLKGRAIFDGGLVGYRWPPRLTNGTRVLEMKGTVLEFPNPATDGLVELQRFNWGDETLKGNLHGDEHDQYVAGQLLAAMVHKNVSENARFKVSFDRESWSFMEIATPANLRGICWLFIREQLLGFRAAKRCANLDCRKVMTDAKRNSKEYCSPKCRMHVRRHPDRKDTKVMELG